MKLGASLLLCAALAALSAAPTARGVQLRAIDQGTAPETIKSIVKLLEDMLSASKKEGDDERDLYAKYKCYCDDNEGAKKKSIEQLTTEIGLLESEVAGLQASNGELSTECAKLQTEMDANTQAQATADALRESEKTAFEAEEQDLIAAIDQLGQAIDALAAIGADQTLEASADHAQFMAGYKSDASLLKLKNSVKQALLAANTFLAPGQRKEVEAFLQAPFTGTYMAQSGGVVGILKGMKETFESNLASAQAAETAAITAHGKFIENKKAEFTALEGSYNDKQATLGNNDLDLGTKKGQLTDAVQQKADDEKFLADLTDMCGKKAKEYEERQLLRLNEEAAISKAIAILNSDHAFHAFGKVTATTSGATSLLQLSTIRRRSRGGLVQRQAARQLLQKFAVQTKSKRLAQMAGLLTLGNPFTKVFEEVDKMKALIEEEGKQDLEQKNWCESEQQTTNDNLEAKKTQITNLEGDITTLEAAIDHPQTGLKKQINDLEDTLDQNAKAQKDETAVRRTENKDYQESVGNCQQASLILKKAISVLKAYYKKEEEQLEEELGSALIQKEEPAPPATWDGDYAGQSEQGGNVIGMLEFVLTETEKEETAAHQAESEAQGLYEDSMADLKEEEKTTQETLASAKKELADKLLELEGKHVDLDKTEEEKVAIERYLERIKPGCDWIAGNYDTREANRATEKGALDKVVELLKATPAHAAAEGKQKELEQGPCAEKCKASEAHVECKACLADVSIAGYCAGHPTTPGCS